MRSSAGAGQPLQLQDAPPAKGRHIPSPLEIAMEVGNHALALLLLCNGYDPNLEEHSPLDPALQARRWDLLDLLLEWGADPHRVELEDLFGTYRSDLFERFRNLGVDITDQHAIAWTLAEHTSNKPLFGFAKRHRKEDPRIQRELDTALAHHAGEANEKGGRSPSGRAPILTPACATSGRGATAGRTMQTTTMNPGATPQSNGRAGRGTFRSSSGWARTPRATIPTHSTERLGRKPSLLSSPSSLFPRTPMR